MKLLCVSDHKDPLVYSSNIKERFKDVDLILSAGDLDMEYLGFITGSLNKPLAFVFGNHNLKHIELFRNEFKEQTQQQEEKVFKNYFGSTYVGFRVKEIKGLLIAGLGGSMKYNKGANQFTETAMFIKALKLLPKLFWNRLTKGRYLDILLTHAPPKGIHDKDDLCHRGYRCFLWFMRKFNPRYLIHGHVHLYDLNANRKTKYHNTMVINAYDHLVLNYEEDYESEK